MTDIVSRAVRSRMMAGIKASNTRPEREVRRFFYAAGLRYRLHDKRLPGRPDLVLYKYKTAVFVHGCFWHRHEGCHLAYKPKSNVAFWESKFNANVVRDQTQEQRLRTLGWNVIVIWECTVDNPALLRRIVDDIRGLV